MSSRRHSRIARPGAPHVLQVSLGALLALALIPAAVRADGTVYKWVDAQNRVHYSDRPPPDGEGQAVAVNTGYSKPSSHAAANATPVKGAASKPSDSGVPSATDAEKKVAADIATAHGGDCQKAKSTYETYIRVRHLYRPGDGADGTAGGDRQYLSDTELEQARVAARQDMDDACGTAGQ